MNVNLFNTAMVLYLLASVLYAVHLGAHRSRPLGLAATASCLGGFLVNTAAFGVRWLESFKAGYGYVPLSNMYESMVFFAWGIILLHLLFEWRLGTRALGALITPLGFLSIAAVSLNPRISSELQPLVPALQSNWLTAHVVTCFIGYAAFAIAFATSVGFLAKRGGPQGVLPAGKFLDDVSYRAIAVGFPFLTLGILTGAIWANYAWGTYWSWDPKETWSLITWLVYAAYLHARFTAGWKGPRLAWLSAVGFAAVLFTYWGVNFVLSGLHSYG
ncbi:MAG: c-type cytochrome biogenesis protein CcsB [Deltaproteobacteria bacterium]|nr:c-type cytochrome biogenesis protein CcsB [Deltaproteobacteria bacterium]